MKKILFCLPLLLLALQSCEIEDEYMYDKGLYTIDWDAAADSSSVTLIDRFWNTEENYFNYGNDGSIKDFHYWPQAHAMDVMIDAYNRTGDSKYSDLFDKWYVGIKAKNGGSYWNNFYDDMEWIALTMIRLYEVTDENKYLETSQEMWNEIKTGWNDYAGGGIAWTHDRLWSKNACSNGPAALIAARLYRINGNQEDLDWAVNIYKWERENLFNPAIVAAYFTFSSFFIIRSYTFLLVGFLRVFKQHMTSYSIFIKFKNFSPAKFLNFSAYLLIVSVMFE